MNEKSSLKNKGLLLVLNFLKFGLENLRKMKRMSRYEKSKMKDIMKCKIASKKSQYYFPEYSFANI